MKCSIVKPEWECTFMSQSGCGFGDAQETCLPIADKCEGCENIHDWPSGRYCKLFAAPETKWVMGICNMATHVKVDEVKEQKRVNPLKASKRGAGR